MLNQYGTSEQFLKTFNPDLQTLAAKAWKRAYTGTAPTLTTVSSGYGEQTAILWLCIQLENINNFAGAKEKMTVPRQKELSKLILTEYAYLKVSELLLFFYRLKCGRYGRFYSSVDALFISAALLLFIPERKKDLNRIQAEQQKQVQEEYKQPATPTMSCDEYLQWKKSQEGTK